MQCSPRAATTLVGAWGNAGTGLCCTIGSPGMSGCPVLAGWHVPFLPLALPQLLSLLYISPVTACSGGACCCTRVDQTERGQPRDADPSESCTPPPPFHASCGPSAQAVTPLCSSQRAKASFPEALLFVPSHLLPAHIFTLNLLSSAGLLADGICGLF